MQIYHDFPKAGIEFVDVSPTFADVHTREELIHTMVRAAKPFSPDLIVGAEARGWLYGILLADRLQKPFVLVRKAGKLPGEVWTAAGQTEYGDTVLQVQKGAIPKGSRVLITDDVVARGGTLQAIRALVEQSGATVVRALCHVVLEPVLDWVTDLSKMPPAPDAIARPQDMLSATSSDVYESKDGWVLLYHPTMTRLAHSIAKMYSNVSLADIQWDHFPDGSPNLRFPYPLENAKVMYLMSIDHASLMEQLSVAMILPRQGVRRLEIVLPFYSAATMDAYEHGVVATGDTYAHLLSSAMSSTQTGPPVITFFDLHNASLRFCFKDKIRCRLLTMVEHALQRFLTAQSRETFAVVFPDQGSFKRFRTFVPQGWEIIICGKQRIGNERKIHIVEASRPLHEYHRAVIVDDLVRSGGTLAECCKLLKEVGIRRVDAFVTHAAFEGETYQHFLPGGKWQGLGAFYTTDSIPEMSHRLEQLSGNFYRIMSIAPQLSFLLE